LHPFLHQISPVDFPSGFDLEKIITIYDTLLEGKSVSIVFEMNEVEILDGESRICILSSKTVHLHTPFGQLAS
jgi:hypothetical protein